ncbi:hypothetical protein [Actinomadura montaniterrae]|nr:hypothetical protein [Actinomadura montaniterrae]
MSFTRFGFALPWAIVSGLDQLAVGAAHRTMADRRLGAAAKEL